MRHGVQKLRRMQIDTLSLDDTLSLPSLTTHHLHNF